MRGGGVWGWGGWRPFLTRYNHGTRPDAGGLIVYTTPEGVMGCDCGGVWWSALRSSVTPCMPRICLSA
jgi:hypothetical protein